MHAWNIILNNQTSENQFVAIKEGLEIVDGYGRYPKESFYNNDFYQSLKMHILLNRFLVFSKNHNFIMHESDSMER